MKRESTLLDQLSRVERLREIVDAVKKGVRFSAFSLAVKYDISINVVYRDIKTPFPPELIQRYLDQLRLRLGPAQKKQPFVLSSPKDSPRSKIEAIEVYEFPALPPHPKAR